MLSSVVAREATLFGKQGESFPMNEISSKASRYATCIYAVTASYFWYLFHSLWVFLGKNYFPQDVSAFYSIQNPSFDIVGIVFASVLTLAVIVSLVLYRRLRLYVLDVGDELSRVAWPSFTATRVATLKVIALVIVAAIVLFFADTVFLRLINFVMSTAA